MAVPRPLAILIVDDEPFTADSLSAILSAAGHEVRTAYGGAEALRAVDGWAPDVALLDLLMPGVDGFAVAERLAGLGPRRPILIAVTGLGGYEDCQRTREAGFAMHMVKPVNVEQLVGILNRFAVGLAGRG